MGKFNDPSWQQKLPPILMKRWPEIVEFQKECYVLTLKVLTLFAVALNVHYLSKGDLTRSCRLTILRKSTPRLMMF